jgi:multiple sugar transport system substrate-binding protein
VLAACGTPATEAPLKSSQPATAAPAATPANSGSKTSSTPVEITFSMWGAPEELTVWKQIVTDFEAANPNIKVNVEVSDWDAYWDKLKTQLAAGTPPDPRRFAQHPALHRQEPRYAQGCLPTDPGSLQDR